MSDEITDEDRALARRLLGHPAEQDEMPEPAKTGNHVGSENGSTPPPSPHDDARAVVAALFSN